MRWFKHLTCANRDEKLSRIIDEFGIEGYGLYWIILETIAEKMDEKSETFATFSAKKWRKIANFSPKKFQKYLEFSEKIGLFFSEFENDLITISAPNLLKFRDEYTRKKKTKQKNVRTLSGESQESVRTKETETETETDTEAEYTPPTPPKFSEMKNDFYDRYGEVNHKLLDDLIAALKTTRKSGTIADSVLVAEFEYFKQFDVRKVLAGVRKYLQNEYHLDGKPEKYLRGIIRNITEKEITGQTRGHDIPPNRMEDNGPDFSGYNRIMDEIGKPGMKI